MGVTPMEVSPTEVSPTEVSPMEMSPTEECRALRNFSSLCAIVSALQSSPVHRLKHSWEEIGRYGDKGTKGQGDKGTRDGDTLSPCPRRDAQRSYEELSAICSEQDNYSASRQLLFQVCPQPCPLSPNLCPLSPALSLYLIPFFCPDLSSFAPISAPCRCPRACPR
ncbi:Ral guanine nucleotide dissociation stimulator [Anas platyrhynchos]|uniref:Ral guanine nucleotide dissociation stimulator n=1 Tax=Anas platyrhynchos TaxID=8839 RepID=R0KUX0_ANAPL|nr:Ral guanine nucleotide dissociation stimulator [Anas platyrhynchos]